MVYRRSTRAIQGKTGGGNDRTWSMWYEEVASLFFPASETTNGMHHATSAQQSRCHINRIMVDSHCRDLSFETESTSPCASYADLDDVIPHYEEPIENEYSSNTWMISSSLPSSCSVTVDIAKKWMTMATAPEGIEVVCNMNTDPYGTIRMTHEPPLLDQPILSGPVRSHCWFSMEEKSEDRCHSPPGKRSRCELYEGTKELLAPRYTTEQNIQHLRNKERPRHESHSHVLEQPIRSTLTSHNSIDCWIDTSMSQTRSNSRCDPDGLKHRSSSIVPDSEDFEDGDEDSDFGFDEEENEASLQAEATKWKTAVDPKSGRTYWYNVVTRETQWRKPLCCATATERREAAKKEQQTRDFFAIMEANILKSISKGTYTSTPTDDNTKETTIGEASTTAKEKKQRTQSMIEVAQAKPFAPHHRPSMLVRTISSMEASVLADLIQRVPSYRVANTRSSNSTSRNNNQFDDDSDEDDFGFQPLMVTTSVRDIGVVPPLLSPIQEGQSPTVTGTATTGDETASWSSSSPSSGHVNVSDEKHQLPTAGMERDISLNMASLLSRQPSETSSNSSFHLSNLMMRSANGSTNFPSTASARLNMGLTSVIHEDDNEDESLASNHISYSSQMDHSTASFAPENSVGRLTLSRETGSLNLTRSVGPAHDLDASSYNSDGREGLTRMHGSKQLDTSLEESQRASTSRGHKPVSREVSLNLTSLQEATAAATSSTRDLSMSLGLGNSNVNWGSFWSEADKLPGLSKSEGQSMRELVAITQDMANVELSSSSSASSSSSSLEGLDTLPSDDTEENRNVSNNHSPQTSNTTAVSSSIKSFGDALPSASVPVKTPVGRPLISRPVSLRESAGGERPMLATPATAKAHMEKPGMLRRNTCGTLYVGSTMSAPDKDATIKCVCAVYRAHILQSELDNSAESSSADIKLPGSDEYGVFRDLESERTGNHLRNSQSTAPPTLEDITLFYRDVFARAQMESDCIIMTLIYVERLIKVTGGAIRPQSNNWRSILFSCMVLASKVWDDLSMWNADFSQTCPAGMRFTLQRVNELEIAVLQALQFKVKVPASEYAKYYFLLRSMLIKSGLGSDDLTTMNPLDVEGAKQLQHVSAQYQVSVACMSDRLKAEKGRSKSTGTTAVSTSSSNSNATGDKAVVAPLANSPGKRNNKVGLEHLVHM